MAMDNAHSNSAGLQTIAEVATECSVCDHPRDAHDTIAARYCTATIAGDYKRGCVCTIHPTSKTT
jgi:hypothetical protein